MIRRSVRIAAVALIAAPRAAWAHSLAIHASTPFAAPRGYAGVAIFYLAAALVLNAVIFRRLAGRGWPMAIGRTLLLLGLPALGLAVVEVPAEVFGGIYGLTWERRLYGSQMPFYFLVGNSIAIVALLIGCWFAIPRRRPEWLRPVWCANLVLYVGCLVPYLVTGAFAHGWAGSYTQRECGAVMARPLCEALARYAYHHDGHLPVGRSFGEGFPQLAITRGNESEWLWTACHDATTCPVAVLYEPNTKPYVWNPAMSGRTITEIRRLRKPEVIISCPYAHGEGYLEGHHEPLTTKELIDAVNALPA